jgi:signal peptidase
MSATIRRAVQVALVFFILLAVAPASAGGTASYVTVTGNSMLPTFHSGDTVMLARRSEYEVGQIIAYRSQQLGGTVVIHRIIDLAADGRYVTKGDNNGFIDSYHPSIADILGEQVLQLPSTASWSRFVSKPIVVAAAGVMVAGLLYAGRQPAGAKHHQRAGRGR